MFIGLQNLLFGKIPDGIRDPGGSVYTTLGKFFHDMHANAYHPEDGSNPNFHPIAACTKDSVMALAGLLLGNLVCRAVPFCKNEFKMVLQGAPLVYAASIIYTAV